MAPTQAEVIEIKVADDSDRFAISELRGEVYRETYGDSVRENGLEWNDYDSRGIVLKAVAGAQSNIVSTMRISWLQNETDFQKVMTFSPGLRQIKLPVVSINRLATHKEFRSLGLIGVMRKIAIQIASNTEANAVIGSSESSSRHFNQLYDLGYEVSELAVSWTGFLKNNSPILLGVLSKDQFPAAIGKLESRHRGKHRPSTATILDSVDPAAALSKWHRDSLRS